MININKIMNTTNKLNLSNDLGYSKRSQVFVDTFCNYRCEFCYYSDSIHKKSYMKPFRQLEVLSEYGITDIEFTGGEPTIYPNWGSLLSYAKKLNFRQIGVITNGHLFHNIDDISKSKDLGLNEVLFSLHSHDEEVHDSITNIKGSWRKIILAIENANKLGLVVRLNSTIYDKNYKLIPEYAKFILDNFEVSCMNFLPINFFQSNKSISNYIDYTEVGRMISEGINILKDKVPFITARFIPFCFMRHHEEHVCNQIQHAFDHWDWSVEFHKLDMLDIDDEYYSTLDSSNRTPYIIDCVDMIRKQNYFKPLECKHCKYLFICDGIENELSDVQSVHPIKGDIITDPLNFNPKYSNLKEYQNEIL